MVADRFFLRPLYLQLRDALAERIATGEWKVDRPCRARSTLHGN
jgi:DNA-binding GntR family transcriptional regulator